ncbi:hypothetical protein Q8A67_025783 [Cirrhinus molitorella]|uniref:Uncharacterized protein n=1 Tax=Cirrhinus molitorella TaxID=172907 RepID=A0AA88P093_9TELE|nr:hypothetical protein Q8A67_025783 [Cirrhinus molitorella]
MEKSPTVISILTFRRQNRSESGKVKEVQMGSGGIPKSPRGVLKVSLGILFLEPPHGNKRAPSIFVLVGDRIKPCDATDQQ